MKTDSRLPDKGQGDYQYLISLDNDRALSKVRVADKVLGRIVERTTDAPVCRRKLGTVLVRTHDDRGPIMGLDGDLMHSQEWQYPFTKSWLSGVGIKSYKAKGTVKHYDRHGYEHNVEISVDTGMTITEMKENPAELRRQCEEEAAEVFQEQRRQQMEDEGIDPSEVPP